MISSIFLILIAALLLLGALKWFYSGKTANTLFNESIEQEKILMSEREMLEEKSKKIWQMGEIALKEKHKIEQDIQLLRIEKEKLESEKQRFEEKVKKLWATSTSIHKEKRLSDVKMSEAEKKALLSQMNPHFIFNSLNSIDNYIQGNDIENSSFYIHKFARLIRMILENSRKEEVSLKEDFEVLELYMQMENLSMQNKVECSIEIAPAINAEQTLIPPMLLQPFIENAFKHAFGGVENPKLTITVTMKNDMIYCVVTDNGKGRQSTPKVSLEANDKKESLGLKLTQERLDVINKIKKSKAYIAFEDLKDGNQASGTKVEVAVPVSYAF